MWYKVAACHHRGPFAVAFMVLLAAAGPDLNSVPGRARLDP
jgi:hypothetical protein